MADAFDFAAPLRPLSDCGVFVLVSCVAPRLLAPALLRTALPVLPGSPPGSPPG